MYLLFSLLTSIGLEFMLSIAGLLIDLVVVEWISEVARINLCHIAIYLQHYKSCILYFDG